jgi:hypothetical protein
MTTIYEYVVSSTISLQLTFLPISSETEETAKTVVYFNIIFLNLPPPGGTAIFPEYIHYYE